MKKNRGEWANGYVRGDGNGGDGAPRAACGNDVPVQADREVTDDRSPRWLFVTGGVLSGLGKGITAASIARLFIERGLTVSIQKQDPYLNIDPGTMSPAQHGEVFVTEDGAEVDLDLGHYERMAGISTSRTASVTTGSIYESILRRERRGEFNGSTVQIVPHVVNEIKRRFRLIAESSGADIVIVEIGGTVGDMESLPFLEALRQFPVDVGYDRCAFVHLTFVPTLVGGETKTKPTQHSVIELRRAGVRPDAIVCRSDEPLSVDDRNKIAMFATVPPEAVVSAHNVPNIESIPLVLHEQGLDKMLLTRLGVETAEPDLRGWASLVKRIQHPSLAPITVGIAGKYVGLADAYLSVVEALKHASWAAGTAPQIVWIDTETDERSLLVQLEPLDGLIVPGGFGERGTKGKLAVIAHARESGLPFLGICFGMQLAVVDATRHLLGLDGAHSTEVDPNTPHPVVDLLPEQRDIDDRGGTLRRGAGPIRVQPGTRAAALYGDHAVYERHRHRYEVSPHYRHRLEAAGLVVSGTTPDERLVEVIEYPDHPYFLATQYHPEFKSRPNRPSPPFVGLVEAALARRDADARDERRRLIDADRPIRETPGFDAHDRRR